MFCREQVAGFRSRADELKRAGVGLTFIGCGTASMAEDFATFMQLEPDAVWTDPSRQTYAHLGFTRGWLSVLDGAVLRAGVRAMARGFRQGRTQGDPVQQGGVLVVKQGGDVVYAYASVTAGDHPPVDEVVSAALALQVKR
jgi:hypothetical protein